MNYILFDDAHRDYLLPLTFLRPIADIRVGILTIRQKWEHYLGAGTSSLTEPYLSIKFPVKRDANNILINGSILPNPELVEKIMGLHPGQVMIREDILVAYHVTAEELDRNVRSGEMEEVTIDTAFDKINFCWDIFNLNSVALIHDYELLTKGRTSAPISQTNNVRGRDNIFIEEGAVVEFASLNATQGPVYIGKNTEIMEGSMVRGPFAILDHSVLKMGTRIYGGTTIGPCCKIGGELNNTVFFGYSNKAHDGFIGHSVIAEWCNLGANTNNSNLKNTYDVVRVWNYPDQSFINTNLQFCGMIMGDHSKTGISTMINTGTVIGVFANVFGTGFPRNFIPSFSWGGASGFQTYDLIKAIHVATLVMKRRDMELSPEDENILQEVFYLTFPYRREH